MQTKKIEGYLVSKHVDRIFMAFLLLGGITLFVIFPILVVMNG